MSKVLDRFRKEALHDLKPYLKKGYVPYVWDILGRLQNRSRGDYPGEKAPAPDWVKQAILHVNKMVGVTRCLVCGNTWITTNPQWPDHSPTCPFREQEDGGIG